MSSQVLNWVIFNFREITGTDRLDRAMADRGQQKD